MNKQGKVNFGFGNLIVAFVLIIVGMAFFLTISQTLGGVTETYTSINETFTATASSVQNLRGQAVTETISVTNQTSGTEIPSTLYTISNNQVVDGLLTATVTINATGEDVGAGWNLSYGYEPEGYIGGASRSIALIIPIMFALAIVVIAIVPSLRSEVLSKLN